MSAQTAPPRPRSPWSFVPTLYFAEGLPYILVNLVAIPLFKGLGASNEWIGVVTSLLSLPWALKVLWSPLVERSGDKRVWILGTQAALVGLLALCTLALFGAGALGAEPATLAFAVFAGMAFVSATHDVAIDGYYLEALEPSQQALFVGIRNTAYKLSWLFGTGLLVYLAGRVAQAHGDLAAGWGLSFALATVALLALLIYHWRTLPRSPPRSEARPASFAAEFVDAFASYLRQPRIALVLSFIFLFRLGDALLLRMAQPFLMDPVAAGGLGLSTQDIGLIYGTIGTLASLVGGLLGGWLIARYGLRRSMLPLALTQNLLILLYLGLAMLQPELWVVGLVNAFEHLAYGLGIAAYSVFLMQTVQPQYKATHYAIATSLMALGWAFPGAFSGFLSTELGYAAFFGVSFALSLPGLALVFFLPYRS